jgi:DNA excision repair protein ERCC-4
MIASVLIDSREPEWVQSLLAGYPRAIVALEAGDIWLSCGDGALVVVERKTALDFLNTLRADRLFMQATKLREYSPWAYMAVTGQMAPAANGKVIAEGRETGWEWSAVQGALLTVQELGVAVVQVPSDYAFEAAIERLGNRDRSGLRIGPAKEATVMAEGEVFLASLPGVGPEKARALLDAFQKPIHALTYLTMWDRYWINRPVSGIADGTRRRVRKALGLDDGVYIMTRLFEKEDADGDKSASNQGAIDTLEVAANRSGSASDAPVAAIRRN